MKISWLWLGEYVDINLSVKELAERLTLSGTEIASITPLASDLSGVVVGEVISKDKHPRADRLSVCRVDVGEEILTIVCGAPNVAAGQKVPTALLGSILSAGFKIEAREIRGVFSQGMICSERELNISEEAAGIMILADDAPVGRPLKEVIPLGDMVLEAELTPNRSDCMSMVGIAREVAIICQTALHKPAVTLSEGQKEVDKLVRVNIEDVKGCPRYTARLIQGVKVGPSPFWLSRRIEAAGVRSINNVVDVTNYVMLELGQPLHAFDYDLLAGAKIQVRRACQGEKFITLDEKEHLLDPEILLICDGQKPVALAGIMGGLHSEVTAGTQNILLESAYFHPAIIRRGSKKLNISTESSQRFDRGVDPNGLVLALDRAAQLIAELAGGTVERGVVDLYPKPIDPLNIILRIERVNHILGTSLSSGQVAVFMEKLGFKIDGDDPIKVQVPTFRPDISREIDLIEEIARLYGYDKIKASIRIGGTFKSTQDLEEENTNKIKSALCGLGLQEVVTNSLTDPDLLTSIGCPLPARRIINPLSEDLSVLRPSLIPSLLQVLRRNFHRTIRDIRIFELGKVFHEHAGKDSSAEQWDLCAAIAGRRSPVNWDGKDEPVDFYDLKGFLESLMGKLSIDNFRFLPYDGGGMFRAGFAARLMLGDNLCGTLGQLAAKVKSVFDLEEDVFLFDLNVSFLIKAMVRDRRYVSLPKFPAADRDLAIVVPEEVLAGEVERFIQHTGGELVVDVCLFDVYRGKQIASKSKGLAFSIRYQSPRRTLTDTEVEDVQQKIIAALQEDFRAELRD